MNFLKGNGVVRNWGYNGNGELGDGTATDRSSPYQVGGITNAVKIVAGRLHSMALLGLFYLIF